MSTKPSHTGELFNPFPGLRPFTQEESHLFFGREGQSKSVLSSLKANNFVAVIGASGSGKSSLIYCGVIPELKAKSEKNWIAVTTRPGTSPIRNMVAALNESFPGKVSEDDAEKLLLGDYDINEWLGKLVQKGQSLLLVIDQFEEIFRFKNTGSGEENLKEVERFVELIHNGCSAGDNAVSVVLTMRSDFIGECSVFQDLTSLINQSNYLIPQMTRQDFRKAIEGPVKIGGATIEEDLVEQLLDEMGSDTDQLPVLQHALMRTWDYWLLQNDSSKPITIGDYEAIGRMEKALSDHANEAYDELSETQRDICENMFKTLTEKGGDNRGVRRPTILKHVAEIARCSEQDIIRIAEVFRIKGRTFLTPYQPIEMNEETVLDISHESLMRIWDKLRLWVDEEANSVQMYNRLSHASELFQAGTSGLWRPPDLQLALNWRNKQKPTVIWAIQYNPAFERAMVYLENSDSEFKKEEENKVRLQRRRLRVTRIFSLILGAAAVVAMGLFLYAKDMQTEAVANAEVAILARDSADIARQDAFVALDSANVANRRALVALDSADVARRRAVAASDLARRRQILADRSAREAKRQQKLASAQADTARMQTEIAEAASELAYERRMLSIAKSMAVKSLQIDSTDDLNLKALMAYQAYLYNIEFGGDPQDADIYAGLYDACKSLLGANYNVYKGHRQPVASVQFIPGQDKFYTADNDGEILLRSLSDPDMGYEVFSSKSYSDEEVIYKTLTISKDGKYLAAGTDFDGVFVYDLSNSVSQPVHLNGHEGHIRGVEFSPSSDELYTIGMDMKVLKWSLSSEQATEISSSEARYNDITMDSQGKILATCDKAGKIQLIDLENLIIIDAIQVPVSNSVTALDFSSDGKFLAAGDRNGTVKLFETENWMLINSLRGSSAQIASVRFSANSTYLASSSFDGSVLVWEMRDLKISPLVMDDNKNYVLTAEFSPDEQYIISGSDILVVRPVKTDLLIENFCAMLSRNFTQEEWELYVGADIEYENTCLLNTEK